MTALEDEAAPVDEASSGEELGRRNVPQAADPAGTFRGGFYVDTVRNGDGCLYRTTAHDRGHWDYSTGFRCCADPG